MSVTEILWLLLKAKTTKEKVTEESGYLDRVVSESDYKCYKIKLIVIVKHFSTRHNLIQLSQCLWMYIECIPVLLSMSVSTVSGYPAGSVPVLPVQEAGC